MAIEVSLKDAPKAWEVDSAPDMLECLVELSEIGYRGELSCCVPSPDADGPEWLLCLNSESGLGAEVKVRFGERVLLTGGVLRCLSADEWSEVTDG